MSRLAAPGLLSALFAATLVLAACAGAPAAAPPAAPAATVAATVAPTAAPTAAATPDPAIPDAPTPSDPVPADPAPAAATRPLWHALPLTDARTGAPFTLADFAGKTVFVEPFATWCTNCRQQLANVHAARQRVAELGRDDVVFVALSVEPNIGRDALVAYAADTGYDLVFAAMPPELLQALAGEFGQTIANPPATPHFVIQPDGTAGPLVTGIESTVAILAQVGIQE